MRNDVKLEKLFAGLSDIDLSYYLVTAEEYLYNAKVLPPKFMNLKRKG